MMVPNIAKKINSEEIKLKTISVNNEIFYKISNVDAMRPFFMSIVSDSNHWMFIASNGGITAGRKNADYSIFPYYTDDKVTESAESTGSKTIFIVEKNGQSILWEPFSLRNEGRFLITRNLYKNRFGNKIIFEEINHELDLVFQYEWNSSNLYGFVKRSRLLNQSSDNCRIRILDGLQNILPFGVGCDLQNKTSNLADAYKRSELITTSGLGIFALSAIIVDKAEPSEALKANIAWSKGLENPTYLLSSLQLQRFRIKGEVTQEEDIKGEKGAYFVSSEITLLADQVKEWMIIINANQTYSAIVALSARIKNDTALYEEVLNDIEEGTIHLKKLTYAADGLQYSADDLKDTRHYSNVLFNIMRGGIFDNNYQIEKWDFSNYLQKANTKVFSETQGLLQKLTDEFSVFQLREVIDKANDIDFYRLATEYLPLKFSRRHGDPSRPWNQFSINTRSEIDGSKILDYQGNWRDIFQNWEALAHSYPEFTEGMLFKFLNASTFEGYNPYRVTKDGFDWETIEPDNPWSYIGYWGDHQIIYLLKFLEFIENYKPGYLNNLLSKSGFVYANVPYIIKSYEDILKDPKNTIEFDEKKDQVIRKNIEQGGADGAILTNGKKEIVHVSFIEKILATLLSKLSNFIPEGGIWMNTQRPEWNDANNALVGNGVSMVTLYYLRRFLNFFKPFFTKSGSGEFDISSELTSLFTSIKQILQNNLALLNSHVDDKARKKIMDDLGNAGSNFRSRIYLHGFSGDKEKLSSSEIASFIETSLQWLEHSIMFNRRNDGMYHAYNLVSYDQGSAQISHLSEMLEGQVAVLSAGCLTATESLQLLDALKKSRLYRKDQHSYLLYPNKELSKFVEKNKVPSKAVESISLLKKMDEKRDVRIIEKDIKGEFHFNGNFRNAADVEALIKTLTDDYGELAIKDMKPVLQLFEEVFNHKEFTGRSGTFYGYEGLGSIYWHMVSKLLLAVQESCFHAINEKADQKICKRLIEHYYEIKKGIGVQKSPELYGAFPTDPYSHTPLGRGAQQPGMTGQVKEDILSRFGELGVFERNGQLVFDAVILRKEEFLNKPGVVEYVDVYGQVHTALLEKNSLFFTCCQVPVVYVINNEKGIEVYRNDNSVERYKHKSLGKVDSESVFSRNNKIKNIKVFIEEHELIN